MTTLTATSGRERIVELDLLRGFALFGIILVNVQYMGLPFFKVLTDLHPFTDPASMAGRTFVSIFLEGKFITLFSFLFGFGFWIFVSRAREKGRNAGPLFLRRLLILALIGAAHATLFWAGDILLIYAILGLFLMIFLNRSDKTVKVWMILLPVFQILLFLLVVVLVQWGLAIPEARDEILTTFDEAQDQLEQMAIAAHHAYRSSDWRAMIPVRLQELGFVYQGFIMGGIGIFYLMGVFLAGVFAGRAGWFSHIDEKLPIIQKRIPWLLIYGLTCSIIGYILMKNGNIIIPDWNLGGFLILFVIGTPALTAAYGMMLILAYHRWKSARFWIGLGAAGRMSLTIYLTQTLILTTLFYGYGFGLMGNVAVPGMLLMACTVFAIQMAAAYWWMQRFHMGPFEWLWRAATYGHLPPFRKKET